MSTSYKKIVVNKLSPDFRAATSIQLASLGAPGPKQIVVRVHHCGINASDINFTNGKYTKIEPPFDAGFEALGEVVAKGDEVTKFKVGDYALVTQYGCFAEYVIATELTAVAVPTLNPEVMPLAVSGLTASIALEQVGQMKSGESVLVTAAAGGTGQFAVQLAKLAGNHVIGTCSSDDKVEFLKKLGCDRVINYKKEDLNSVLRKEYPNGIDLVYESVGGDTFEICVNNLAVCGRLIIIGMVSGYENGNAWDGKGEPRVPLPARLIRKSASVRGFFLNNFVKFQKAHGELLFGLYKEGKLKSHVDNQHFQGIEQIADAIDYMYKGRNIGKLVVSVGGGLKSKV